jgi:hypothetical protein
MRVCDDEERAGVVAFLSEFNKGEGVENVVQRFAASATERLEVTFSSTERKLAHQLAEELGLGHESVGEGEQRVMVLTKAANFAAAVTDAAVFRGYLALCGPSVEFIASKFAERVPQKGLAKSERKLWNVLSFFFFKTKKREINVLRGMETDIILRLLRERNCRDCVMHLARIRKSLVHLLRVFWKVWLMWLTIGFVKVLFGCFQIALL